MPAQPFTSVPDAAVVRGGGSRFTTLMKVTSVLLVAALLTQAITAGQLLSTAGGRDAHAATAIIVMATGAAHLVTTVLVWRPGNGSPRFALTGTVLLAVTLAEFAAGEGGATELHVPLGASLLAASTVLVTQIWSRRVRRGST